MTHADFDVPPLDAVREAYRTRLLAEGMPVRSTVIGHTLLGRPLEVFSLGTGPRHLLYVGAHRGTEWLTASVLYRFLFELSEAQRSNGVCFGVRADILLSHATLYVLPLVNADGCELAVTDTPTPPLVERQVRMSGGEGFLRWRANARGVDLTRNYDHRHAAYKRLEQERSICAGASLYSGEYPESEPECAALANFVRAVALTAVLSLQLGENTVDCAPKTAETAWRTAVRLSRLCGCEARLPTDETGYGDLCQYAGQTLGVPSFTLSVDGGRPHDAKTACSLVYDRVAPVLYRLPTML